MGTTAQKLQRVLDTKEGLKDTINTYLGQDITSAIPFKDYETYIKNFYNSLPKTDYAEGSNITLSNTLKGKLDFEDGIVGYGDTSQDGTPTPDTPIEIEVVRGKNRSTINSISTTGGGYVNYSVSQLANVTKGETYTLSLKNNTSYTSNLNVRITSGGTYSTETQGNLVANGTKSYTFTASQSGVLNLSSKLGTEDITNALTEIQLEKGSQVTSFLPYNTLEATIRGKNKAYVNSSTSPNVSDFAKMEQGKTYTFSMKVNGSMSGVNLRYGETAIKTFYGASGNISHTFVAPVTGTLNLNGYGVDNFNGYENIQLEEGSIATTYEPYQTPQTYQLSLGEYEFAGIGNYVDTIEYDVDEDKVYKNKNVNKIASYNGETISTDYISTTGQLTTGATIYYGITTTREEITGTLKDQIKALYYSHSFTGTTIIEIDGQLPMIIKVRALKGE